MPANLPPEYFQIEARYRAAGSTEEKIDCLEELLSVIPKHKGTDHLRGDLRRRLSKLRAEAQDRKRDSRRTSTFRIAQEGAGQVVVIGPPNVGKSALVAALTNATPEVADYPYTTQMPTPGMMSVADVQIQLIDTPALDREVAEPELLDLIRRSDLILLVVDLQAYPIEQLEDTIAILEEHRIIPRHLQERYAEGQRLTFIPLLVVVNKNDDKRSDEDMQVLCELYQDDWLLVPVSAATGRNLERLRQMAFEQLEIIRVYAKPPGQEPDLSAPFALKKGSTVAELAAKIHKDFFEQLKTARVWGSGVYDGQIVSRDHVLQDGDIVELRI